MMKLREELAKLLGLHSIKRERRVGVAQHRRRRLLHEQMEDRRLMAVIDLATLTKPNETAILARNTECSNCSVSIAGFAGQVTARQNGPAIILDNDVTVTRVDSANFAGTTLTIAVTVNSEVSDRIDIKHTGNAAGQIGISGNMIRYGNKFIGTFAGTTTLVVALNRNATTPAVQTLLRNVTFNTVASSTANRTVQVSLNGPNGALSNSPTKTVRVIASNVAPSIANFGEDLTFDNVIQFGGAILVSPTATVSDPDTSNFQNGKLTISTLNAQAEDQFSIRFEGSGAGEIRTSYDNVIYDRVVIGTKTGGMGKTPLVVTFNSSIKSTSAAVQALLRNIMWGTKSPILGSRKLSVTLSDGDGGTSNSPTKDVNVIRTKVPPFIYNVEPSVSYSIRGSAIRIAPRALLATGPFTSFTNGNLTISVTQNGEATDLFGVKDEGVGIKQIGVSGVHVTYGGILIGTLSGGSGLTPLVVNFNANATRESVQRLIKMVTWRSTVTSPSIISRVVVATLTDGDVLQSAPQSIQIRLF